VLSCTTLSSRIVVRRPTLLSQVRTSLFSSPSALFFISNRMMQFHVFSHHSRYSDRCCYMRILPRRTLHFIHPSFLCVCVLFVPCSEAHGTVPARVNRGYRRCIRLRCARRSRAGARSSAGSASDGSGACTSDKQGRPPAAQEGPHSTCMGCSSRRIVPTGVDKTQNWYNNDSTCPANKQNTNKHNAQTNAHEVDALCIGGGGGDAWRRRSTPPHRPTPPRMAAAAVDTVHPPRTSLGLSPVEDAATRVAVAAARAANSAARAAVR